jgi:hypothetical protein
MAQHTKQGTVERKTEVEVYQPTSKPISNDHRKILTLQTPQSPRAMLYTNSKHNPEKRINQTYKPHRHIPPQIRMPPK